MADLILILNVKSNVDMKFIFIINKSLLFKPNCFKKRKWQIKPHNIVCKTKLANRNSWNLVPSTPSLHQHTQLWDFIFNALKVTKVLPTCHKKQRQCKCLICIVYPQRGTVVPVLYSWFLWTNDHSESWCDSDNDSVTLYLSIHVYAYISVLLLYHTFWMYEA